MRPAATALSIASLAFLLASCGDSAKLPEQASVGAKPADPRAQQVVHSHR